MKIGVTKRHVKIVVIITVVGVVISLLAMLFANSLTNKASECRIFESVNNLPECNSALLLGTSKYLRSGRLNPYFTYRIDAAVELYKSGKVSHIVISGDNSIKSYHEPQDMKDELVKRGVPASRVTLDYAGFNTYDSVQRMKLIFGQCKFIVISQKFHNQRAIYIAQWIGLNVYGYNAKGVSSYFGIKVNIREKLARVKMFIDLISSREPKFLGEQILLTDGVVSVQ